ncbi:MAG: hypothetical protein HQ580_09960 [Planctomycetes bacterium]|nr:hypothetical protein [Planctomycetota bacterium]
MSTRRMFLGLAVCLLLGVFAQQLLSRNMRSGGLPRPDFERMRRMNPEEKVRYFQKIAEEQRRIIEEQEALAMQQALGADEQQWRVIEPKLKKVRACRDQAFVGIGLPFQSSFTSSVAPSPGQMGGQGFGGFSGGFQFQAGSSVQGTGFQSSSPFQNSDHPPTEGERICEELQLLLQVPDASPGEINQKLAALRQARAKARRQLVQAQQELRKVLNFRQQARLVLMGLLD